MFLECFALYLSHTAEGTDVWDKAGVPKAAGGILCFHYITTCIFMIKASDKKCC